MRRGRMRSKRLKRSKEGTRKGEVRSERYDNYKLKENE
jgi:hypothetical protein